jgi:hypothetical protein
LQNNDKLRLSRKRNAINLQPHMPLNLNHRERTLIYLLLFLFLMLAYLPLSSFLFALKNDALTTNFPNKYFFSASLHAGYLPIWNPYINFGLPLYADPGFAFWNPLTWLFGMIGYSIPMLSVETLFYIWIAGIASFELGFWLGYSRRVAVCVGATYMCCGFFIGNLQHTNFLTAAAFLPFVIMTYLDLHRLVTTQKFFFCQLSIYMLATGGHPAIPIACIYFLLLVQAALVIFENRKDQMIKVLFRSVRINLLLIAGFLILAAPILFSYYEIYPYFTRSAPINQTILPDTGFDFSSYLSFLFPLSTTVKNDFFSNDLLMRNGYFSLAGFLCFLIALMKKKNKYQKIFLLAGAGMLVLSLGGGIKEFLYSSLPLLNRIRTNGEIRVFSLLAFILVGAYVIDDLLKGLYQKIFDRLLMATVAVSLLIISMRFFFSPSDTIFLNKSNLSGNFLAGIKNWLNNLTFSDRIFLNAGFLVVIAGFYFLTKRKFNMKIVLPLFIGADLILFCWTQLPLTGVQMKSPKALEQYFSEIPKGIPIPRLTPLSQNQFFGEDIHNLFGCWSYYSKQPGTPFLCSYPSGMNQTTSYFNSNLPDSLNKKPFLFTRAGALANQISINSFSPSEIEVQIQSDRFDSLILLQNYFLRWKATINGVSIKIRHADIAFMSVPLDKGTNNVRFYYSNHPLMVVTLISFLAWLGFALLAFRPSKPSNVRRNFISSGTFFHNPY